MTGTIWFGYFAPAKAPDADTPVVVAAMPRRVLVVDDNVDSAESLAALLAMQQHEVRIAHNGATALETAELFRPEVIVLDIGLPGMSGHDVARAIRARPWGSHVLLVAATGWGQESDKQASLAAGFDVSPVRTGMRPGTSVATVRSETAGVPTLLLQVHG